MDIKSALNQANQELKKNNIFSYKLDSEILMSNVVKEERDYVILNLNQHLSNSQLINYRKLISERSRGKPIGYLIGKKEFWKYEFHIEEGVLIPRPDTEVIIEQTLNLSKNKSKLKVLEVGIGSGCILLSILKEKKNFFGTGIDISKKCIDISRINSYKLGLQNRIKFFNHQEKNKIMINALVNNADINSKFNDLSENLRIENLNLNFWEKHINAGLTGNFLISSLYYIYLCKFNLTGQIINISSDLGIISPDQRLYEDTKKTFKQQNVKPISYSVVKHGLIGITKYFSTYDTKRLRCNAIAFGGVKVNDKKFEKRVSELIPLNRMANAEEYITTMQYLLSPKSSYVNGSTLIVDGGRTII